MAIVTGAGRAFSAGADLRGGARPTGGTHWETPSLTSLESGIEIWKPVIAAVNGYCLGFALTLVAACDFVIASERARVRVPGGAHRRAHDPGRGAHAAEGGLAERDGAAAHRRARGCEACEGDGPGWKVVPHERLMGEAHALAQRLCQSAPLAVRATKEVASRGQQMPFVDAIRFGETMRRVAGATDDAKEGMAAAREKRAPTWQAK